MLTAPESWTSHLHDEFDWFVATVVSRQGIRYRCATTNITISESDLTTIRDEVIAIATTDTTSLAYQILLQSGMNAHTADPCPTCDAAIRLAWGSSPTRRALRLPAGGDDAPEINPDRTAA